MSVKKVGRKCNKLLFTKLCFRKIEGDKEESEARLNHAFSILFEATARIILEDPNFGVGDNKK